MENTNIADIKFNTIYYSSWLKKFCKVIKITDKSIKIQPLGYNRLDKWIDKDWGGNFCRIAYYKYVCDETDCETKPKLIKKTDGFQYVEGTEFTLEYGCVGKVKDLKGDIPDDCRLELQMI